LSHGLGCSVGITSLFYGHTDFLPYMKELASVGGWDEWIIIDNGSPAEYRDEFDRVAGEIGAKVLHHPINHCIHAQNVGTNLLSTDVIVMLSNDVVMTDRRWLEWLLEGMGEGIIQGPRKRHEMVPFIDGSTLVIHRNDWNRIGGYDVAFRHPGYYSDVDLCWRACQLGVELRQTKNGLRELGHMTSGGPSNPGFWEHFNYNKDLMARRLGGESYDNEAHLMKINVGSKNVALPDYLSVDLYWPDADIQDDARTLSKFLDNSVEEVYCAHMLEHLGRHEGIQALKSFYRVLRPKGKLVLIVPDVVGSIRRWLDVYDKGGDVWGWYSACIWGNQQHEGEFHKSGYDRKLLERLLTAAGFVDIHIEPYDGPQGEPVRKDTCILAIARKS